MSLGSTLGAVHRRGEMIILRHRKEKAAAGLVLRTTDGLSLVLDRAGRTSSLTREQADVLMRDFPGQFHVPAYRSKPRPAERRAFSEGQSNEPTT